MRKYTIIELFAGAGGMALGFKKAGFKHLSMVEVDKWAVKTLNKNFKLDLEPNDITNISDFNKDLNINENIDVVAGGFPCQSFSYAGKRKGIDDTRGTLFYDFARAVRDLKPKVFVAENVQGLVKHDEGRTLKVIIETFENEGYDVTWKLLNSNDHGVPQKRKRIFIIGLRKDINIGGYEFTFPKEKKYKPVLRDVLMNVPDSDGVKYNDYKYNVMKLVPPGGCWRDLPDDVARDYMKKSYYLGGGKTGMARRLSMDEPSLTLTTSPSQNQTERCHPIETRPLNIREYARIQTFPDNFIFEGSIANQYKQIGNAVPVNLAKEVAKKVKELLDNEIY